MYEIVKHIHLSTIVLSVGLFLLGFVNNTTQPTILQKMA
jgi:uncharacterized membrane protein SirB2